MKKILGLCLVFIFVLLAFPFPVNMAVAANNVEIHSHLRSLEITPDLRNRLQFDVENTGTFSRYVNFELITKDSNGYEHSFGRIQTVLRPGVKRTISFTGNNVAYGTIIMRVSPAETQRNFFVCVNSGNNLNPGTYELPFETIEQAQRAVRQLKSSQGLPFGGVTVYLREGHYRIENQLRFDEFDSGWDDSPIIFSAWNRERVEIKGSTTIPTNAFVNAGFGYPRDKVMRVNLRALGITGSLGGVERSNSWIVRDEEERFFPSSTMLYVNAEPQTIARYPSEGYLLTGAVIDQNPNYRLVSTFEHNLGFNPNVEWAGDNNIWVRGFFRHDWFEDTVGVTFPNAEHVRINEHVAFGILPNREFYFYNILSELTRPGEFYVDTAGGFLYFYPNGNINEMNIELALFDRPLIYLNNARNIRFKGFEIKCSRNTGIVIRDSENIIIEGSTFYGLGGQAVRIISGQNNGVLSSDIFNIGRGGVRMEGGCRITLTPAGHFVENSDIWDFCLESATYTPAIFMFYGVGHIARHNRIHSGPHVGITFAGNHHIIEYNEFFNLVNNSGDAGAIYAGRDWTHAGNIIRNNFFHDIQGRSFWAQNLGRYRQDAHAIYMDDMASGNYIYGNIFYDVFSAVFLHGSRNTTVNDNIVINSPRGIWLSNILSFNTYAFREDPHYLIWNFRRIFTFGEYDRDDPNPIVTPVNQAWNRFGSINANVQIPEEILPPEGIAFFESLPLFRRMDMIPWDQANFPKYNIITRNTMYNSGTYDIQNINSGRYYGRLYLQDRPGNNANANNLGGNPTTGDTVNVSRPASAGGGPGVIWNATRGISLARESGWFQGNTWYSIRERQPALHFGMHPIVDEGNEWNVVESHEIPNYEMVRGWVTNRGIGLYRDMWRREI